MQAQLNNFVARQMCEYMTIHPTVASVLDHMLFASSNGYRFNHYTGMPSLDGMDVDTFSSMSAKDWDVLIKACREKAQEYAKSRTRRSSEDLEAIAVASAKLQKTLDAYRKIELKPDAYSQLALVNDLKFLAEKAKGTYYSEGRIRPAMISNEGSMIAQLDDKTPDWFIQIAHNMCHAWAYFLTQELKSDHVWKRRGAESKQTDFTDRPTTIIQRDAMKTLCEKFAARLSVKA